MTKKSSGLSGQESLVGEFDFANVFAGNGRNMKAMAEAQEHFIGRVAKMNREIASFVDRRLKHDRRTVHALAECETPQDAVQVWSEYLETASRHYRDEMTALTNLGFDQTRETVEDVQHGIEESVGSMSENTTRS